MNLLARLNPRNYRFASAGGPLIQYKELTLDALLRRLDNIRETASGIRISPENAMDSPTVSAVINGTQNSMAQLPFVMVERVSDTERKPLPKHNISVLLNQRPNAWQTRFEYWAQVIRDLLLWGNYYALTARANNGRVVSLQRLLPGNVEVMQLDSLALQYTVTDGTHTQIYPQSRIHHIRGNALDGIVGTAPPIDSPESIAMEIAIQQFGASLFASGALPHVVIERPGHFRTEEDRAKFSDSFKKGYSGKRGTVVIEEGWTVKALQMSNEESQFLETRKLQRQVIAGLYGIPPHRVGDLERATFSNIEHQSLEFVTYCLDPLLVKIEQAIVRDLIPREDHGTLQARFNVDALLRGDFKSRQEGLKIQREMGVINADEWRKVEDMPPREDGAGDEYIVPMNMAASGSQPGEPAAEPAPPAPEQIGGPPQSEAA